jgi:O-antigen/teichoic acid export membrane protein
MFRNIAGYLRAKIDVFIIGKLFTSAEVGKYTVSQEFAILPQTEIVSPTAKPLFGLLSNNESLKDKYEQTYKFMSVLYFFIVPSVVGVNVTADLIASVLLGDKWNDAGEIIKYLSVLMLPFTLQPLMNNLYDFNKKGFVSGFVDIVCIVVLSVGAIFIHFDTLNDFSYFRFFIAFFSFTCILLFAKYFINIELKRVVDTLAIPTVSALVMGSVVAQIEFILNDLLMLIIKITSGAFIYSLAFFFLSIMLRKKSPSAEWILSTASFVITRYFKKRLQIKPLFKD